MELLSLIVKATFLCAGSKTEILQKNLVLQKELEIYRRKIKSQIKTKHKDRIAFFLFHKVKNIQNLISIVKPETLLRWSKQIAQRKWDTSKKTKRGRPPIATEKKQIILKLKLENFLWGAFKIQGELRKISIKLDKKTIWKTLRVYRKQGKIKPTLTWSKFLKMQAKSLFAMDFFTVDTMFGVRYYVHFIISHSTREIVRFAITENPVKEFVRQQLVEFTYDLENSVYMIHDNAKEFLQNYASLNIRDVRTSPYSPDMNAIAERFVGSVRREAMDYFIIFNKKQLKRILEEYIEYYNRYRPHQGINQQVPKGYASQNEGKIVSKSILSGLHHHYFRTNSTEVAWI